MSELKGVAVTLDVMVHMSLVPRNTISQLYRAFWSVEATIFFSHPYAVRRTWSYFDSPAHFC
jgi:hypothetical protein